MTTLNDLTTVQLQRIIAIKEQIEDLQGQIDSIAAGGDETATPPAEAKPAKKRHRMSRAARAAIAAGARARWARIKGTVPAASEKPAKKRRKMSAAVKAKLAAAARARWRKAKAAGKTTL